MPLITTVRQIYQTAVGLAEYGHRLPATERWYWRSLSVQLQDLADQDGGYVAARHACAPYAEQVMALQGRLAPTDTPAGLLAVCWIGAWVAEFDAHANGAAYKEAPALHRDDAAEDRPHTFRSGLHRGASLGSRHMTSCTPMGIPSGWAALRVGGVMLESLPEHWRFTTLGSAVLLTCTADSRPWEWRQDYSGFQARIGPPHDVEQRSAGQLVSDLEHLARGLNPGWWPIDSHPATGHRPSPCS